jgi:2-C-methyl-D-erythritol 4-phosphate cytidylyltransferase/2-C-methyl-D-erythritol 2,4-cyclodiphosphate synthase
VARADAPGLPLRPALAAHRAHPGGALDDVEVARAAGLSVAIVEGDEDNIKVTHPGDLARAARILESRMDVRTGNGYDVHAFGRATISCSAASASPTARACSPIPDGDVGLHALTDAILGALAQGDIGQHFPPSDPQWKGAASHLFLRHAKSLADEAGFRITHADVTLVCEAPKVGPMPLPCGGHRRALGTSPDRISVKATDLRAPGLHRPARRRRRPRHGHAGPAVSRVRVASFFGGGYLRPASGDLGVARGR